MSVNIHFGIIYIARKGSQGHKSNSKQASKETLGRDEREEIEIHRRCGNQLRHKILPSPCKYIYEDKIPL